MAVEALIPQHRLEHRNVEEKKNNDDIKNKDEKREYWETYDFVEKPVVKIGVTHAGFFHPDDVFSTAFLEILYPNIQIMRVIDVPIDLMYNKYAVVYDIGKHKYDHHGNMKDKDTRGNGISRASFGKLWRDFGKFILPDKSSRTYVDVMLVQEIDRADNGYGNNLLSTAFKWFNKSWEEDVSSEETHFKNAVSCAKIILNNLFQRKLSEAVAFDEVNKLLKNQRGNILVLDRYMPVSPNIRDNVYYYIYPAARGGFNISPIINKKTNQSRRKLPTEAWISNPPKGFKMYHEKFCNFETREEAIVAITKEIQKPDNNMSIIDVLNKYDWKVEDSEGGEQIQLTAVDILHIGVTCPCFEDSTFYSLNPIKIGTSGAPYISNEETYGTMINDKSDKVVSMDKFNALSDIKISTRVIREENGDIRYIHANESIIEDEV